MHVHRAASEQVGQARAVGQKAAGYRNLSGYEHSRYPIVGEKIDDPPDAELVEGIVGHQERIGALPHHGSEGVVEFIGTAHRDGEQLYPQRLYRHSQLGELGGVGGIIWIPKKGHTREGGNNLLEELQPFSSDLRPKVGVPGDIASGPGEARYQPGPHWIANSHHDDGGRRCRLLGREGRWRTERRDEVDGAMDQLDRDPRQPIGQPTGVAIVECDVLAFQIAKIAQAVPEGVPNGRVVDDADTRDLRRLLRTRCERPRGSGAKKRNEVASPHSITSSASASSLSGTVRPSALAVVRLTTRSNLVGCSTGMSAGFAPRKILLTISAARRNKSVKSAP